MEQPGVVGRRIISDTSPPPAVSVIPGGLLGLELRVLNHSMCMIIVTIYLRSDNGMGVRMRKTNIIGNYCYNSSDD